MKFKKVAALVLASAMTLGLAACGNGNSSTPSQSSGGASSSGTTSSSATEISLWSFNIGGFTEASNWDSLIAAFNEANPDIKVTVTPINYQDGDQKLTSAITSGSGPDIIFEGPERIVGNYAREGLMVDLGDLREGFWDQDELVQTALEVEREMPHLELAGVGTNLGCYGTVQATPEKMNQLVAVAERVEAAIGRKLDIISGGASSSIRMVLDGTMPPRINHLRVGEGILFGRIWGCDMDFMHKHIFTLRAEVIESKVKPSYPVGELSVDAFGRTRTYVDRGRRRRALLAMGRVDYGECEDLIPREPGVKILGASSDHTIVDVQNTARPVQVGDILEFDLCYATMVYLTSSRSVSVTFKTERG